MNTQLKELKTLWPKIPEWARDKILSIARISIKQERWKMVVLPPGKENSKMYGKYLVSNLGRLKNISTGKIVTQYNMVVAMKPVHRLVALTWLKRKSSHTNTVMHLDGDGTNNWVGNLKWGTPKKNAGDKKRHDKKHSERIKP